MSEIAVNTRMLGFKDVHLHVEDHGGDGRTIILIHGWPLSGASWSLQVGALLEAGYRVITYDRRGFGQSDKPKTGYGYDTLAEDLSGLIEELDLHDVTIVGFSMGGGEAARYIAKYGEERLHSVVFAAAITPMLMNGTTNPDGPLPLSEATKMSDMLSANADAFYDSFITQFYSSNADGALLVSEEKRQEALAMCRQADKSAALQAMQSFATTDFRDDLPKVTIPTLVIHADTDGIVPFIGSADRTHKAIPHSELHVITGGTHGINVSNADEFNQTLIAFLAK
jgi:non-heme chloroperoxidase